VFLDRDGTIIEDADYLHDPGQVRLIPGAADAIRHLNAAGWRVVVVTNQSGVARGYFDEGQIGRVHARVQELLGSARVDGWYYCPHVGDACLCRKPKPGMLLTAAVDLGIHLADSWMVGDKPEDVQAGVAAGCRTVRVRTGKGAHDGTVADVAAAVAMILPADQGHAPGQDGTT
jgi:D-glycero-D-manno-heptose 1,7-bisphosphate phosphatase